MGFLRRMFKWMFSLLLVYVLVASVIVGILLLAPELWSPPLKEKIQKLAKEKANLELTVEKLKVARLWPTVFRLQTIQFSHPSGVSGLAQYLDLGFLAQSVDGNWARPRLVATVQLGAPEIRTAAAAPKPQPKAADQQQGEIDVTQTIGQLVPAIVATKPQGLDLGLRLGIEKGTLVLPQAEGQWLLTAIDFQFSLPSMRAEIWQPSLELVGQFSGKVGGVDLPIPFAFRFREMRLSPREFEYKNATIDVAGLSFIGSGSHGFLNHQDRHNYRLQPADLNKIPPTFLPKGQWQGQFSGQLDVERPWPDPAKVTFQLQSEKLQGQVDFQSAGLTLSGGVSAAVSVRGRYQNSLAVDDLSLLVQAGAAKVSYAGLFHKPAGVDLDLNLTSDLSDSQVNIRRFMARLAHARLEVTGAINYAADLLPAQIQVNLNETALTRLESLFPPLAVQPALGAVSLRARIDGPIKKFEQVKIQIQDFQLKQFSTAIKYPASKPLIQGRVKGHLEASGDLLGTQIQKLRSMAAFDLSNLAIDHESGFKKAADWPLKIDWIADWQNEKIQLSPLRIHNEFGQLWVRGSLTPGKTITMNLESDLKNFQLDQWKKLYTPLPMDVGGVVNTKLSVAGKFYPSALWSESPLAIRGQFDWLQGSLILPPAPSVDPKAPPAEAPVTPEKPLLPSWWMVKNTQLGFKTQFLRIEAAGLKMAGVAFAGRFQNSTLNLSGRIQQIFSGALQIDSLQVKPAVAPMNIDFKGQWQKLQAEQMLEWFSPGLKGFMKGQLTGQAAARGSLPLAPFRYDQLIAQAQVKVDQGVFQTLKIEEMLMSSLARFKIPAVKSPGATGPIPFTADTQVQLSEGQLNIKNLNLLTAQRDQIQAQGWVKPDLTVQLNGQVAIASIRVGGAIAAANADKEGRLLVPMQITGPLMSPNLNLSEATIKKMAEKAVVQEAKKQGEQLIKKTLEKEVKNKLKNIFGK